MAGTTGPSGTPREGEWHVYSGTWRARARRRRHRSRPSPTSGSGRDEAVVQDDELLAYIATVAGVLIAAAVDETIDARLAWILVSALGIGYMLSRGLAKSGSTHRDRGDMD